MELIKTKKSDLPAIRKELLEKQRYRCPITGRDMRYMKPTNLVVDHCHHSGVIRGVLPRGINGLEGQIKTLMQRCGGYAATDVVGQAKALYALADYILLHRVPQTPYLHHTYLTPAEQRAKRNAQARKRYAASKKG